MVLCSFNALFHSVFKSSPCIRGCRPQSKGRYTSHSAPPLPSIYFLNLPHHHILLFTCFCPLSQDYQEATSCNLVVNKRIWWCGKLRSKTGGRGRVKVAFEAFFWTGAYRGRFRERLRKDRWPAQPYCSSQDVRRAIFSNVLNVFT